MIYQRSLVLQSQLNVQKEAEEILKKYCQQRSSSNRQRRCSSNRQRRSSSNTLQKFLQHSGKLPSTDSGEDPPTDIEEDPPTRGQVIPDSSNSWSRGSFNTVLTDKLTGQEVRPTVFEGNYVNNLHQHFDLPRSDSEKIEKVKYYDLLRERDFYLFT